MTGGPDLIPDAFAETVRVRHGARGDRWLRALPGRLDRLLEHWGLRPVGPVRHGQCGVVVPTESDGVASALKVSWIDERTRWEPVALRTWDGRGAARLLRHAPVDGAMLMERLDGDRSLELLPEDEAVPVAAALLRRLAVPAPEGVPTLAGLAREWTHDLPARWARLPAPPPARIRDAAVEACRSLGPHARTDLVDHDLHYANVLAGRREPWLAIDPKVVSGDVEFGACPLLWNRLDPGSPGAGALLRRRLDVLVDTADLDPELTRAWSLVRALDFWLWQAEAGADTRAAEMVATFLSGPVHT